MYIILGWAIALWQVFCLPADIDYIMKNHSMFDLILMGCRVAYRFLIIVWVLYTVTG